jgi:hypothetical protein
MTPYCKLKPGDRVLYVGDQYKCYWGVPLTVKSFLGGDPCCYFDEPGRPGGLGVTTWIRPEDLIPEEAPL